MASKVGKKWGDHARDAGPECGGSEPSNKKLKTAATMTSSMATTDSERQGGNLLPVENWRVSGAAATAPDDFFKAFDPTGSGITDDQLRARDTEDLGMGRAPGEKMMCEDAESWMTLGDIFIWLNERVDEFLGMLCKTLSMGRLFPCPRPPLS